MNGERESNTCVSSYPYAVEDLFFDTLARLMIVDVMIMNATATN